MRRVFVSRSFSRCARETPEPAGERAASPGRVPGRPPRHARVLYLCSPAARPTVARARDALAGLAARVEIRDLPPGAAT